MAWASLVFEVVGVPAGRGLGGHVSCPRPLPAPLAWRHPTGFAGVFHATVSGLVVGLSRGLPAGGRGCGRWCVPQACSTLWA